jgi:hypothetical protein
MSDFDPQRPDETDEQFIARRLREIEEERQREIQARELPAE